MSYEPVYRRELLQAGVPKAFIDETDNQFRALGRVNYQFACILRTAYLSIAHLSADGEHRHPGVSASQIRGVRRGLAELGSGAAMEKWFDLCASTYPHDEAELDLLNWFRSEFTRIAKARNAIAHGILAFGYGADDGLADPDIFRISATGKMTRPAGLGTVAELDGFADDVWYFRRRLSEYASVVFFFGPVGRVRLNFTMRNSRVERIHPLPPERELFIGG